MKKTILISAIVVLAAFTGLVIFNRIISSKEKAILFAETEKGTIEMTIFAAGELIAEESIEIRGPEFAQSSTEEESRSSGRSPGGSSSSGSRSSGFSGGSRGGGGGGPSIQTRSTDMHAMDLKILDLVPEGTIVKEGDYVAQLDKTTYDNTLRDEIQNLETLRSNLEIKILDTAMTMTNLRDQIKNQKYSVEEAEIELEQSKFEPPAVVHRAEVKLDREKRELERLNRDYVLRSAQTLADINAAKLNLDKKEALVKDLGEYIDGFTIRAPAAGMIIYQKDRRGSKKITGSSISPFDMVVATLPDLSSMISKLYVSEIEVSKINTGQNVDIVVDAFPDRKYTGKIIFIANVGEQLPNSDAKMFEVQVRLNGSDQTLRPAMTTGNKILLKTINDVIYIPTECIQTGSDSIPYVYLRNRTKNIILPGESNDKFTIIEKGLDEGTFVYLIPPEDPQEFRLKGKELIPLIKQKNQKNITAR